MDCLFCGDQIVDASLSMSVSLSKNCEFSSSSWCGFHMHYYVCINKRIAIFNDGWLNTIKREFFTKGTFISYDPIKYKTLKLDYRPFLEEGFVF